MFKGYATKPQNPVSTPFANDDVPADWAAPAQTPAAPAANGFFTEPETTESPFEGAEIAAPAVTRNVLNSDVSVVGVLRFTDDLLVDGSVEGEITSDGVLTVGSNASIQAGEKNKVAIRTKSAIIHGRVMGDIVVSDRVELASTAELVGDVTAAKIAIQEGAVFVGNCRVGSPVNAPAVAPAKKSSKAAAGDNLLG